MSSPDSTSTRRRLLRGVAWATPVALMGASAPAIAASFELRYVAPKPSISSPDRQTTTWTVPEGITRIRFIVDGAGGGGASAASKGGSGARVTGEIVVQPGAVLTLVVAAGGSRDMSFATRVPGGGGFGNGDYSPEFYSSLRGGGVNRSGSGGGASAILLGSSATLTSNVPLVIVGGGGGGAGSAYTLEGFVGVSGLGGDAQRTAVDVTSTYQTAVASATARGGRAGNQGVSGPGGPAGAASVTGSSTLYEWRGTSKIVAGSSGGAGFNAAGGGGYGGGGGGSCTTLRVAYYG